MDTINNLFPINPNPITQKQVVEINPLVLAYVGDGVYSLYVRTRVVSSSMAKTKAINTLVNKEVNAIAQAAAMTAITPLLTEEEDNIFHRARNSHVNSIAKNASLAQYKHATCFEAVVGYLYLTNKTERAEQLLDIVFNSRTK